MGGIELHRLQSIDISALCVHPACVVSVTLTALRTETGRHATKEVESVMLNVSGRLLMVQREQNPRTISDNQQSEMVITKVTQTLTFTPWYQVCHVRIMSVSFAKVNDKSKIM